MSDNVNDTGMTSSEEFGEIQVIGKGCFADTSLVKRKADNKSFVVKKINLNLMSGKDDDYLVFARKEVKHPNIVNLFSSFGETSELYLVMEYCAGGDLQEEIDGKEEGDYFLETQMASWTRQLAAALEYLHGKCILHRNVTAQNVFLTIDKQTVKLGDLEVAKAIETTDGSEQTETGDPSYSSPEVCDGKPYDAKSEAWSLGVLVYYLAALKKPFEGNNIIVLRQEITQSSPLPLPDRYSTEMVDFVSKLMLKSHDQRLSVSEALSHSFLVSPLPASLINSETNQQQRVKNVGRNESSSKGELPTPTASQDSETFFQAALEGRLDMVKSFITERKFTVDEIDGRWGRMALHKACEKGHIDVVTWLVQSGASVKATSNENDHNTMPIHSAAAFGQLPVVRYLVEEIDEEIVYCKNGNGETPMLLAARGGHLDVLKYLIIDRKVNIASKDDRWGRTALHNASIAGNVDVVKWLIRAGSTVDARSNDNNCNYMSVHLAAYFGNLEVVKFFIEHVDERMAYCRNRNGETPMLLAAQGGQLDVLKYFILRKGVNIEEKGGRLGITALHMACENGHLEVIKWLIRLGANVKAKSNDSDDNDLPIHLASYFGQLEVVKLLIEEIDKEMVSFKNGHGEIPMLRAARAGQLDVVKYFIVEKKVNIDSMEELFGRTALHIASENGHLELVKWLVQYGANVKAKSNDNDRDSMPIHSAAAFGHLSVVKFFIAEIDEGMVYWKNEDGQIPMFRASFGGQLDVVKYFILEKGVNVEEKGDRLGRTALHIASEKGHLEIVKWLVQYGANVEAKSNEGDCNAMPIHSAAVFGQLPVVKFFIEEVDEAMTYWKNGDGLIPMFVACVASQLDVIKYFIQERKVNIEESDDLWDRTALHIASEKGHLELVKWLLQAGANVKAHSNEADCNSMPIHVAAYFGQVEVVKYFVEEIDKAMVHWKYGHGEIPLHRAARGDQLDVVKYFISERNVNIEAKDERWGRTVLHVACENGHLDMVKWLIETGANVKAKSNNYDSNLYPVHFSAIFGHLPVLQYFLVDYGLDIDTKGERLGRTSLHYASWNGRLDVVKWLIQAGANVKAKDSQYNDMPIHIAARVGQLKMVKFFIEEVDKDMLYWKNGRGEIPMLRAVVGGHLDVVKYFIIQKKVVIEASDSRSGRTALHRASERGHLEVVKWLIEAGANVKAKSEDTDHNERPIHIAAYFGQLEVVQYFVHHFPKLQSIKDGHGRSPLDYALFEENTKCKEVIQFLSTMKDGKGRFPFDMAKFERNASNKDIRQLLKIPNGDSGQA